MSNDIVETTSKGAKVISIGGKPLDAPVDVEDSPEEILLAAVEELRSGEMKATQIIVVALDSGANGNGYNLHMKSSFMRGSEQVGILEAMKTVILRDMI